jgi:drug/metabolite transporter (DMT)-like permease
MKSNSSLKSYLLLHGIVLMWGFTGILGKLIHLPFDEIVWHRLLIAVIGLFIAMKWMRKPLMPTNRGIFLSAPLIGIVVALHWMTFYFSIQLSTASLGILCLATTTLHVTWLEPLLLKTPFSWVQFILSLVVLGGIYLVAGDFKPNEWKALGFGLSSALFAAIFSVSNARLAKETPAHQISLIELSAAFVFLSVWLLVEGKFTSNLFRVSLSDGLWLLFLGLLCTSFAFLASIELVKKLGPFTVSLTINLEPVYTILLAILLLNEHEKLNAMFYVGAVIIILTVLANSWWQQSVKGSKTMPYSESSLQSRK